MKQENIDGPRSRGPWDMFMPSAALCDLPELVTESIKFMDTYRLILLIYFI